MKTLLNDLQERLRTGVPALKYIDEDWGQLDYAVVNTAVKWPCVLIDTSAVVWTNTLKTVQMGEVQIKLRIADLRTGDTSTGSSSGQNGNAFPVFELLKQVHLVVQGFTGHKHYSGLVRTAYARIKREDGLTVYDVTYSTELVDNSTERVHQMLKMN